MDKPDPYAELGDLMHDLERRGVPHVEIIDAAFQLAVMGAVRLCESASFPNFHR
jgi:hypothetical protein